METRSDLGSFRSLALGETDADGHRRFIEAVVAAVEHRSARLFRTTEREAYRLELKRRAHANCLIVLRLVDDHLRGGRWSARFVGDALQWAAWVYNEEDYDGLVQRLLTCTRAALRRTMFRAVLANSKYTRNKARNLCLKLRDDPDDIVRKLAQKWLEGK